MNIRIEAGPMTLSTKAVLAMPGIKAQIVCCHTNNVLSWTCFNLPTVSINGHSLKAINPEFVRVGELATSLA
jgi:hypothetical protein